MFMASAGSFPCQEGDIRKLTYPPRNAPTGFLTAGIAVACDRMLDVWKLRWRMEDAGAEISLRARRDEVARVVNMMAMLSENGQ